MNRRTASPFLKKYESEIHLPPSRPDIEYDEVRMILTLRGIPVIYYHDLVMGNDTTITKINSETTDE